MLMGRDNLMYNTHGTGRMLEIVFDHLPEALPAPANVCGQDLLDSACPLVTPLFIASVRLVFDHHLDIFQSVLCTCDFLTHRLIHAENVASIAPIVIELGEGRGRLFR